jgi:hypothetical protein
MKAIDLGGEGQDRALRQFAHRCTKGRVGRGEFEIQLRR